MRTAVSCLERGFCVEHWGGIVCTEHDVHVLSRQVMAHRTMGESKALMYARSVLDQHLRAQSRTTRSGVDDTEVALRLDLVELIEVGCR